MKCLAVALVVLVVLALVRTILLKRTPVGPPIEEPPPDEQGDVA